jgi:hypothetical protein
MTGIYEHPLLYGPLAIVCPACGGEAVFDPGHGGPLPTMRAGKNHYDPGIPDWSGDLNCPACGMAGRHELNWPSEAYFTVDHGGQTLWALDHEMMVEFRAFIAAGAERKTLREASPHWRHLMRIPSVFLTAKAREPMLKKIDRVLGAS